MPVLTEEALIQIRRDLHAMPELALNEVRTEAYLEKVISGFNQAHLTVKHIADLPTALLVRVAGSNPKRTLGYRTDIDALPVSEKTGLPFASKKILESCMPAGTTFT